MTRQLPFPLTITDAAKAHLLSLMAAEKYKDAAGLRIGLKSSGCSGMKYTYEPAPGITPTDLVLELGPTRLLVDRKHEMYLLGSTLDFKQEKLKSGFEIINPLVESRCGCGESVAITPQKITDL